MRTTIDFYLMLYDFLNFLIRNYRFTGSCKNSTEMPYTLNPVVSSYINPCQTHEMYTGTMPRFYSDFTGSHVCVHAIYFTTCIGSCIYDHSNNSEQFITKVLCLPLYDLTHIPLYPPLNLGNH